MAVASCAWEAEKIKRREIIDSIWKLESRISALQWDKSSDFYSRKQEICATNHMLVDYETKLNNQSSAKKKELSNHIKQIKMCVVNFSDMLTDLKPGQAFVEKLKHTMEEIEAMIVAFKQCHGEEFELLVQEEKVLTQEIIAFDNKLESWPTTCVPITQVITTSNTLIEHQCELETISPPSVIAFERFIQQTGGHQGGWDDYDHQTFRKLRNRYTDMHTFLEAATHEIPTKTVSEIEKHDQWYTEYSSLLKSKKEAIDAWKRQKQHDRSKHADAKAQFVDIDLLGTKMQDKRNKLFAEERKERFEKLSAWKDQKEYEHTRKKEEKQTDKDEDVEKERKRRALIKRKVEQYINKREETEKLKIKEMEFERYKEKERGRAATRKVAQFRDRDLMKITEKQERLKEKASQIYLREKKLERLKQKVQVNATRDPGRLLRPTACLKERAKEGPGSGLGGIVSVMPKRAVPSWRKM